MTTRTEAILPLTHGRKASVVWPVAGLTLG